MEHILCCDIFKKTPHTPWAHQAAHSQSSRAGLTASCCLSQLRGSNFKLFLLWSTQESAEMSAPSTTFPTVQLKSTVISLIALVSA